jgi:hypothetical protein
MEPKRGKKSDARHPREPGTAKMDITKHPRFRPMAEEDRLKPGESLVVFIPSRKAKTDDQDRG